MAENNKIQEIIKESLENIRTIIDANTVIGTPMETSNGVTIIPVSKISMGFASGGLDFDGKKESSAKNFGGGGGTGLSVQPVGFLVISHEGRVEMINVGQSAPKDTVEQIADLLERTPDIVYRLKMIFDNVRRRAILDIGYDNVCIIIFLFLLSLLICNRILRGIFKIAIPCEEGADKTLWYYQIKRNTEIRIFQIHPEHDQSGRHKDDAKNNDPDITCLRPFRKEVIEVPCPEVFVCMVVSYKENEALDKEYSPQQQRNLPIR
jgi:sporulation protein YtfJ